MRTVFYNEDHSYQEFGKLGEGAGPMQSGTWYWDAAGHNCQLHQFPIDERQSVVCHIDVIARPVGVVQDQNPGGGGRKVQIVKGNILRGLILPDAPPVPIAANTPAYVVAAVNDRGRTPWDVARDGLRRPADVLAFSQIKPGMVVADLVPGEAYYTRMLAKLVGSKGHVYAVVPNGGGPGARGSRSLQREGKGFSEVPVEESGRCTRGCYPSGTPPYVLPIDYVQAIENITEYSNVTSLWEEFSAYGGDFAIPEQADAVFIADGYHQLHFRELPKMYEGVPGRVNKATLIDVPAFTKKVYGSLKPGGY